MKKWIKLLCLVLVVLTAVKAMPVIIWAMEADAEITSDLSSYVASPDSRDAQTQETVAATEPAETVPEETVPEETVPAETIPEETVPAQTENDPVEQPGFFDTGAIINDVPLYFQNDYPESRYGYGTVSSSGCSVTCLAMMATYLTGHEYKPDELAGYVGWRGQNNMERLEKGSELLRLPYSKNTNWHVTEQAIREGKVAIVLMNSRSPFTDTQHFVLITGVSADGKYYINDPNKSNYDKWDLKDGFANGFDSGMISCGFSGAWVYDKAAMPAEPFIYREEIPDVEPRYPGIKLTLAEEDLLAKVVWVEARGESFEGQQAVAEVVLNRLVSDDFPSTLRDLIYGQGQFRSVPYLDEAEPNHTQYEAIKRALNGPYVLPIDVYYFATYTVNENVWGRIGGHIFCYQY